MNSLERMRDFIDWMENKIQNVHAAQKEPMLRALLIVAKE